MNERVISPLRATAAWCLAGAALLSAGCLSSQTVLSEMERDRRTAYLSWKRTRDGRSATELQLDGPLDLGAYQAWTRKQRPGNGSHLVLRGKLNTASAVLIGIGNNKALRAVLEDREKAQGRIVESLSAALPKLDLIPSYTHLDRANGARRGALPSTRHFYSVQTVLTQPIFQGGAISAGIRAAKLFSLLTDEQIAAQVQEVIYQTRLGYSDVLLAEELVKVSEGDLNLAKAHLKDLERKKAVGTVSQYDVLRASVEVSNVEAELIERQNALHLAQTSLFKTLGVSQESHVELTEKLVYSKLDPALEDVVKKAFLDRPEILLAELGVRLNREAVADAESGFLPRVEGNYTYNYQRPNPRLLGSNHWGHEWSFGVTMTWPLFDGLASWGRLRQARADLRRSTIELRDAEEQVLLDVKQSLFSLEDARKFVKSQTDNLARAKEGLRLARAGYNAGLNTELEMLDARQALSETQALYYQAVYRHETAKLSLQRASGELRQTKYGALLK